MAGTQEKIQLLLSALRKEQIVEKMPLGTEIIPLKSPLLWCKYYRLMGRAEKAEMIEKAMER